MTNADAPRVRRVQQGRRRVAPKAAQAIVEALRNDIATGKIARNARLPNERNLAQNFGVSQPTVREALRALESAGLVEIRHGSGVYVLGGTRNLITRSLATLLQVEGVGIVEAVDLRLILGRESARLAATHADSADIAMIAKACEDIDSAREVTPLWEALLSFQVLLSAAARNPLVFAIETFLVELVMQFQIRAFAEKDAEFWVTWAAKATRERNRIVEILKKGKGKPAVLVTAVEAYLSLQRSLFLEDPRFSSFRLSDPESIETLDSPIFALPDYQQVRSWDAD